MIVKAFLVIIGVLLGVYLEAHHPQMFRSWSPDDGTLHRGDKVRIKPDTPDVLFYAGCDVWFLDSQATSNHNMAWVLLKNCELQNSGIFEPIAVETFRLEELERIK